MRASYEEMAVTLSGPGFESREDTWGGMVVARQSCDVDIDTAEIMKALPDATCPCSHWGVVLRGRGSFRWADREFTAGPGDVYFAEPGHVFAAEAGTELVEFTRADEHARVMAALSQVLA